MPGGFALFEPLAPLLPPAAASQLVALVDYERNFRGDVLRAWLLEHPELPIAACVAYLAMVFLGGKLIGKPLAIQPVVALWNLLLAVFSIFGVSVVVPYLVKVVFARGVKYSVCHPPQDGYFYDGPVGFWIALFILSKFPELVDTLLLVLQKKDVIFLHWYHHVTVLLFSWFIYADRGSSAVWFGAMNFTVHSIMYSYYFLMTFSLGRKIAKPFALSITISQIVQMIAGTIISIATHFIRDGHDISACHIDYVVNLSGLVMYVSYLFLFSKLFFDYYISDAGKKRREKKLATKAK